MILDIGCGFARERDLTSDPRRYQANPRGDVNVDIGSPEVRIKNYIRCDANHLCFRDRSFDEVRASHILEHLTDPTKCLREVKRVLKDQGIFHAHVPNSYGERNGYDPSHLWHWKKDEFGELIGHVFQSVVAGVGDACWIPIRGNRRLWGKYVVKIFPFLATELRIEAWK